MRERFGAEFGYASELFTAAGHVDLAEANRRQLVAAGLSQDAVYLVGECSACSRVDGRRKYFSHRAEAGFYRADDESRWGGLAVTARAVFSEDRRARYRGPSLSVQDDQIGGRSG